MHSASAQVIDEGPDAAVVAKRLRGISVLCAIEQQGVGLDPPQLALRHRSAMPTLADRHAYLLATQHIIAVSSGTAKTVEHAFKRWPALGRYSASGTLRIDGQYGAIGNRCATQRSRRQ